MLLKELEVTISSNFSWYRENQFMTNARKCHPFLSPFEHKSMNLWIKSSKSKELLGVIIDSKMRFGKHIVKHYVARQIRMSMHYQIFCDIKETSVINESFEKLIFTYLLNLYLPHICPILLFSFGLDAP